MRSGNGASPSGAEMPERALGRTGLLLGYVMVLAGAVVLGDLALASFASPTFIGAIAILVGASEIIHAVWSRRLGGMPWQMLLGLLYVLVGLLLVGTGGSSAIALTQFLVRSARQGELLLAYVLGLSLVLSGAVRILFALSHRLQGGWGMLGAGTFGVAAGVIVLAEFPKTGFWIFGLLLGIDLIVHGAAWLGYAKAPAATPG